MKKEIAVSQWLISKKSWQNVGNCVLLLETFTNKIKKNNCSPFIPWQNNINCYIMFVALDPRNTSEKFKGIRKKNMKTNKIQQLVFPCCNWNPTHFSLISHRQIKTLYFTKVLKLCSFSLFGTLSGYLIHSYCIYAHI